MISSASGTTTAMRICHQLQSQCSGHERLESSSVDDEGATHTSLQLTRTCPSEQREALTARRVTLPLTSSDVSDCDQRLLVGSAAAWNSRSPTALGVGSLLLAEGRTRKLTAVWLLATAVEARRRRRRGELELDADSMSLSSTALTRTSVTRSGASCSAFHKLSFSSATNASNAAMIVAKLRVSRSERASTSTIVPLSVPVDDESLLPAVDEEELHSVAVLDSFLCAPLLDERSSHSPLEDKNSAAALLDDASDAPLEEESDAALLEEENSLPISSAVLELPLSSAEDDDLSCQSDDADEEEESPSPSLALLLRQQPPPLLLDKADSSPVEEENESAAEDESAAEEEPAVEGEAEKPFAVEEYGPEADDSSSFD